MNKRPRAGTVGRAVWDAMHARWCGPDCESTCKEWKPDLAEQRAAIKAVRAHDQTRRAGGES